MERESKKHILLLSNILFLNKKSFSGFCFNLLIFQQQKIEFTNFAPQDIIGTENCLLWVIGHFTISPDQIGFIKKLMPNLE